MGRRERRLLPPAFAVEPGASHLEDLRPHLEEALGREFSEVSWTELTAIVRNYSIGRTAEKKGAANSAVEPFVKRIAAVLKELRELLSSDVAFPALLTLSEQREKEAEHLLTQMERDLALRLDRAGLDNSKSLSAEYFHTWRPEMSDDLLVNSLDDVLGRLTVSLRSSLSGKMTKAGEAKDEFFQSLHEWASRHGYPSQARNDSDASGHQSPFVEFLWLLAEALPNAERLANSKSALAKAFRKAAQPAPRARDN